MAGREFTVKARITADTKDAERNTRALAKAQEELAQKLTDLKAKFDAGEISATKFAKAQAGIEREAARVARNLSGITPEVEKATAAFNNQLNTLLGFGSAVAVLATVKRAISAIAGASEESKANFDALSSQISGVLTPAANSLSTIFGATASTLRQLRESTSLWSDAMAKAASLTTDAVLPGLSAQIAKFRELAEQERLTVEAEIGIAETRKKMRQAEIDQVNELARLNGQRKSQIEIDLEDTKRQQQEHERNKKFQEDLVAALEKEAGAQFKLESERRKAAAATRETAAASAEATVATSALVESTREIEVVTQASVTGLRAQAREALITAAAFRELEAAQGRAAAVSAAVSSGGRLSSAGRRVQISGGSRLTTGPGLTGIPRRG